MAKDTEGNSSSHQDGRKLNRRYLLGGAAVTAGAGVAVWRGLGDRNEGQRDGDDDVSPESSEKGSEATTPGSSQITDVVGEDGFDLRLGSVHISAPAGVAEPGTQITLGLAAQPIPAEFSAFVKLAGQPVSIVLGDDEQPKQPVTIAFDLRGTELAANVSEITPLAVMSWSSIPDSFELMTGDWNAQSKALTVTTDHLSFEVPFLADIQKFITDTINGFLGLNYAKPECAFDPLTIGSTPYGISHTGNDPVWPCLGTDRNGQLVVDLHSNSNMAWAVKSLPSVSGSVSGDWKDIGPGLAAIYQGVFRILGEERAAVMPGGSVRLPFDPGLGEIRVEIRQSPALYVVTTTLQAIVSVLEALPTGQIAKSVYETFSAFDCITEVINTFYQEESSDIARSVVMTTVGCVSAMIEEQKGSVFNLAARTALAAIGMLSVAANTLIGAVQGIIREWTGNALASYTIAANVRETPDERTGTEVRGPSLDQPIVVKWRFEELGPVYSAPTIDSGTIYLAKQGGLYALDIASGQELWRGDPLYEPGESPVIFNDLVIFHSIYRAGGLLQAFDRRSGTVRWRIGGDGSWPGGCAIANGRLWFSSADILYTVDPATGNDPQEIRQRVSGSTYAFDNTVYAYGYATQPVKLAYLVAIDAASGAERWTFPGIIGATQLAVSADTVFAGSQSGRFHAIDAATGEERWSLPMGDFMSSRPGVADGLVFIDGPSTFSALDVATGEEHWTFSSGTDRVFGAQAIANGVVYVGSHNCLYAIETTGGNEVWRYGIAENVVGGPEIAVGEGVVCAIYGSTNLVALGNLPQPILAADVVIRGTPSSTGAERGTAKAGTIISLSSSQNERDSGTWVAVTINGVGGWIPLDAIDPTTLPPEGEIEYVYMP